MITSRDNSQLKHARAVRDGRESQSVFIEGVRLCEEALKSPVELTHAFYTEEFVSGSRGREILKSLRARGVGPDLIAGPLLDSIADTRSPQGIVLLARRPANGRESLAGALKKNLNGLPLLVVLHEMNNPSNVGAILRTAEAAGAAGAISTNNSADPFSPKALRGSMGANLRLPVWHGAQFDEMIAFARQNGLVTACADIGGGVSYTGIDWVKPHALIIGSEAHGLTPEQAALCDESFVIPMATPVESLNAAVAAGIVMFEARRMAAQKWPQTERAIS